MPDDDSVHITLHIKPGQPTTGHTVDAVVMNRTRPGTTEKAFRVRCSLRCPINGRDGRYVTTGSIYTTTFPRQIIIKIVKDGVVIRTHTISHKPPRLATKRARTATGEAGKAKRDDTHFHTPYQVTRTRSGEWKGVLPSLLPAPEPDWQPHEPYVSPPEEDQPAEPEWTAGQEVVARLANGGELPPGDDWWRQ